MRRSKSNPAKYCRNYRSISQRRMIGNLVGVDEDAKEQAEMNRLRKILHSTPTQNDYDEDRGKEHLLFKRKHNEQQKKQIKKRGRSEVLSTMAKIDADENGDEDGDDNNNSLLSRGLQQELGMLDTDGQPKNEYETADNSLVVLPSGKKKKKKKQVIQLTPQELKQAKKAQKEAARKLKQLEMRAEQKKKRKEMYAKLEQSAVQDQAKALPLMQSSKTLSRKRKLTKRQELTRLLHKERLGMELTEKERGVLYQDRPQVVNDDDCPLSFDSKNKLQEAEVGHLSPDNPIKAKKQKKKGKETTDNRGKDRDNLVDANKQKDGQNSNKGKDDASVEHEFIKDKSDTDDLPGPSAALEDGDKNMTAKPISFAAQMMASLSKLKAENIRPKQKKNSDSLEDTLQKEQQQLKALKKTPYMPTNPAVLKTAAAMGLNKATAKNKKGLNAEAVRKVERPADVKLARKDLPVAAMEFEVMDAIRNNDVVIICGETGSGKSTQVPQFLYEAGMTTARQHGSDENMEGDNRHQLLIGVTQPRRVAAVSTAKRICYEMGQGNGQKIPNGPNGNLVAYHTRYETAGLGSSTHIKFMTDGILLQEIQHDLLLRKYSAIVLDEAHERNLNTDVLVGLLSLALPLRKQAAAEEHGLPPLKVIIMSATLRVQDFTNNNANLFATSPPAVVTVPGRTHQVTIHHSKVTELDNYVDAAFRKVCKIHRNLPQGGILVFLPGKQEILALVSRLRKAFNTSVNSKQEHELGKNESLIDSDQCNALDASVLVGDEDAGDQILRDMDDDEADADLFLPGDNSGNIGAGKEKATGGVPDGLDVKEVPSPSSTTLVLPLYSILSAEEQAKVFAPVEEGCRLIVVATNVAETSITIPGISYVVDTGRQKCRNYNSGTGVASFDIMWTSQAAANQRAGRAGRTGPGHCYRLYSSTMYSKHMDAFALPEVLSRPIEDVVLAMKAMKISNISSFPFPTPPDKSQIDAAVKLLANLGCVDIEDQEDPSLERENDGNITRLGAAVAKLPIGVRYGKILLVAAQAGVLDYAIAAVAALSESNPFVHNSGHSIEEEDPVSKTDAQEGSNENTTGKRKKRHSWRHKDGDVFAAMLAVGAYAYAGRGTKGVSEKLACKGFCKENDLDPVVMQRIHKMRRHLCRMAKARLGGAEGIAATTGGFISSMPPPRKVQERFLAQAIASALLDNVAMLAPLGSIPGEHPFSLRSAYLACSSRSGEPLWMDRNSVLYSRDSRQLPQWVCFESLERKTLRDSTPILVMKNITPIDPVWLGSLAKGSQLLRLGGPLSSPLPLYDPDKDAILCSVMTKFGNHGWEIPAIKVEMFDALQTTEGRRNSHFMVDDSFRWFARFLLEGKIFQELKDLQLMLNDSPAIITQRTPLAKVAQLVSALSSAGVDSASALRKHWATVDNKFLFKNLKSWVVSDKADDAKKIWIETVKQNVKHWENKQ